VIQTMQILIGLREVEKANRELRKSAKLFTPKVSQPVHCHAPRLILAAPGMTRTAGDWLAIADTLPRTIQNSPNSPRASCGS
jgi:hypothetical protein